jgi:hypothetical protein
VNERSNVYDDYKYKDKVFEQYDKVDDGENQNHHTICVGHHYT